MKMLRVGAAYLNMDLVTDVWVNRGGVHLFFAVPAMYSRVPFRDESTAITTRELHFQGVQAAALMQWLDQHATDITPAVDAGAADVQADADDSLRTEYDDIDDGPSR